MTDLSIGQLQWACAMLEQECPCQPDTPNKRCGPCADWNHKEHSPYCYGTLENVIHIPVECILGCKDTGRIPLLKGGQQVKGRLCQLDGPRAINGVRVA